jgi:cytochrome P450
MTATEPSTDFGVADPIDLLNACPAFRARNFPDAMATLRSKDVIAPAYLLAGAHLDKSGLAERSVADYLDGAFLFLDGDVHRGRRKLLNQLVRPAAFDDFRDAVIVPQCDVVLDQQVTGPHGDGLHRVELVRMSDRVFLHFSAKLVGLVGIDTEERLEQLRECMLPFNAAMVGIFAQDRRAAIQAADAAKKRYVEEFYRPSLEYWKKTVTEIKNGDRADDEVPTSFLRFVAEGQHPDYADERIAIIESTLLFVTSVGTSTQGVVNTVNELTQWFDQHPEEYHLRTDYNFLLRSLQETLRLYGPPTAYLMRQATRDFTIDDNEIKAGQELRICVPAANRDIDVWGGDANDFNPHRVVPEGRNRYGVAFGVGTHQCYGLRVVLGSDGTGDSHVRVLQKLFELGIDRDPRNPAHMFPQTIAPEDGTDTVRWVDYPVVLKNWDPNRTHSSQ